MKRLLRATRSWMVMPLAILATATSMVLAQGTETFRLGVFGGVNFNYVDAPIQQFVHVSGNENFTANDFSGAHDFLPMGGIMAEYLFSEMGGITLRVSCDSRQVTKEVDNNTFTPRLVYVGIEPGVRINLYTADFFANIGGTIAITAQHDYDYTPAPAEGATEVTAADLLHSRDVVYGGWAGIGYDFRITEPNGSLGVFVTPFIEGSLLFDQKGADIPLLETKYWTTFTARGGVVVKVEF